MSACSTGRTTAPAASQENKYPVATDAPAVTVVHCTADDNSSGSSGDSSMADSRRQRVLRAVRRPVSTGSRQCVNVLKELLPREVSLVPMHHCLHVGRSIHAAADTHSALLLLLLC